MFRTFTVLLSTLILITSPNAMAKKKKVNVPLKLVFEAVEETKY